MGRGREVGDGVRFVCLLSKRVEVLKVLRQKSKSRRPISGCGAGGTRPVPRSPMAFGSIWFSGRPLAVEIARPTTHWEPPMGGPQGPRGLSASSPLSGTSFECDLLIGVPCAA